MRTQVIPERSPAPISTREPVQIENFLRRYRPLVEDYPAFVEASGSPLPLVIRANTLRQASASINQWLDAGRHGLRPSCWMAGAFRVSHSETLEYAAAYLSGIFHIQEEVALLPVHLLDPLPGERVLDLCAAPGNKTAQISAAMHAGGTIIANDASRMRLGVLRTTMDRLSLKNVVLTVSDASNFPAAFGQFDRILVDVPCSCEGTSRKNPSALREFSEARSLQFSRLQSRILERAIRVCRPGGRIVYSTCTYAPEENECVIAGVLGNSVAGLRVRLIKADVPGLRYSPGITRWQGERLPSELENSMRIWPHQNDTGGFFIAVLEKAGVDSPAAPGSAPITDSTAVSGTSAQPVIPPSDIERFGFDAEALAGYRREVFSRKYASLVDKDIQIPSSPIVISAGVRAINTKGSEPRLSTAGAMLLGSAARESIVDLDEFELKEYLMRRDISARDAWLRDPGSKLVRSKGVTFGLGSVAPHSGRHILRSFFPRTWAGVDVAARLSSVESG